MDKETMMLKANPELIYLSGKEFAAALKGFDAAMDLQLPVLFAQYVIENFYDLRENQTPIIYKNWIENIYTPEQK